MLNYYYDYSSRIPKNLCNYFWTVLGFIFISIYAHGYFTIGRFVTQYFEASVPKLLISSALLISIGGFYLWDLAYKSNIVLDYIITPYGNNVFYAAFGIFIISILATHLIQLVIFTIVGIGASIYLIGRTILEYLDNKVDLTPLENAVDKVGEKYNENLFVQFLKAKKGKYCPSIEIVKKE
jgi:hypothetical protein